jgi:predicted CXXCH cytochrome family protein
MGTFHKAVLAAIGLTAAGLMPLTVAKADVHSATYRGSKVCLACHKSTHKSIAETYPKTAHALGFWKVGEEKEGQKLLGDFSKSPGFTQAQVTYVLGVGKFEQAYLDQNFQLLPLFWETAGKSWVQRMPSVDGATQCVTCHVTGYDQAAKQWKEAGVGCESCHGPGSEHITAADKKATIVRPQTLDPLREAMICGQCHSLGQAKSNGSPRSPEYRPGDDLAATFNDAKAPAHVPHEMPPWTQYSEWVQSKHATASPPTTCTTCHEPHGVGNLPHQLRKEGNALCLDCHKSLSGDQHAPASLEKNTCASCHMPQGSHFFRKPSA